MALTLTTSGSLNTTVDNYAFSILSNTSSVQLGAVSLKLVVPGGCTIKNVNAGTSSVDSLVFLQQDGNLNIGMYTLSNWVVNTNDVILSITASGMSTGSFTLNTDEDWYCEIASSSAEPFTDFAIKMPSLASPYASVSTTLEAVSILSGVNPSITAVGAPNSSVFGSGSRTSGTASIAEGINTLASGLASHAAGINTTASGQAAFSMGIETDADGMASFAAGSGSWARGTATVATGIGTIASASGQTVVGHYNLGLGDFNNLFVVGGGSGATTNLRKNLFRVYGGSGASTVGVEINTSETQYISSFDGFNVYGKTRFFGGVTGSAIDFNAIGVDTKTIQDPILGTITTGSFTSNFYRSQAVFGGGPLDFENVLKASVRLDHRGINFSLSEQTTAPGSTFLWTNSSNRLFYSSSAVILNDGNTLGSTMTIGTNDTNNLQLETNNTTRIFISSSGNVGIGKSNPTARLDISGSVITTGSLSITGSLSLKGPLYDNLGTAGTSDQILFTTSTGVEWRDNIADAAQDLVITGKNVGLTTIPKGTPLYFTGSGTAGNIVGILPADAGNPDRMPAGGVAGEQITAGSEGDVYIYGFISGVNTSAFSSGDDIFVAVGGGYTNIKPTGSALIQKLGNIEKVDPTNGSGVIQGPSWYNDLPNWEIGRVMVGRSTGQPVTSSLVYLDEANGRLGLGTTSPNARLHISGANNEALLIASSSTAPSALFVSGSGNVGIGTATPASRLQVSLPSNTSNQSIFRSDAGDNLLAISTFATTNRMQLLLGDYNGTSSPNLAAISDSNTGIQWAGSDIIRFVNGGSENVTINASGNVGIGTTSPSVRLHLSQSSGTFQRVDINNANADGVNATTEYYTNTGATPDLFGATSFRLQGGTTDAFKQFQVYIANLTSPRFIINGSGNVGIGTTSPQRRLHVDASGSANTDIPLLLTSVNVNNRVGILFASSSVSAGRQHNLYHRNNSPLVEWILSSNSGESATWNFLPQDDTSTGLSFVVPRTTPGAIRIAAGINQSMLSLGASGSNQHLNISSNGNVGIGTTTPTSLLQVAGRVTSTELYVTNGDAIYTTNGSVGIGTSGPTSTNRLQVRGSGATSATTALRVENSAAAARLTILDDGTSAFNTNHLYVSSSGNVGIGTTTPTNTLQVVGGVTATSFTGSLFGTSSWAENSKTSSFALTASYFSGQNFATFTQSAASTTWTFNHNLDFRTPVITVYDNNYEVVIPDSIQGTSTNQSVITFSTPKSGFASATIGSIAQNNSLALSIAYAIVL